MSNKKELSTVEFNTPALVNPERFQKVMLKNFGGRQISPTDFPRVKLPTGGGQKWDSVDDSGEEVQVSSIEGIIIVHHETNAYWPEAFKGGNEPPQCSSQDGWTGDGNPGGPCAKCDFNKFQDGKKPCSNRRRLYFLREGEMLPTIISLPPGSLGAWNKYVSLLGRQGLAFYECVTEAKLEKTQSNDGITYSRATFRKAKELSEEMWGMIEGIHDTFSSTAKEVVADGSDFDTEGK